MLTRENGVCVCAEKCVCLRSGLARLRCCWAEARVELGSGLKCRPGVSAGRAWVRGQKVGGVRAAGLRGPPGAACGSGQAGPSLGQRHLGRAAETARSSWWSVSPALRARAGWLCRAGGLRWSDTSRGSAGRAQGLPLLTLSRPPAHCRCGATLSRRPRLTGCREFAEARPSRGLAPDAWTVRPADLLQARVDSVPRPSEVPLCARHHGCKMAWCSPSGWGAGRLTYNQTSAEHGGTSDPG